MTEDPYFSISYKSIDTLFKLLENLNSNATYSRSRPDPTKPPFIVTPAILSLVAEIAGEVLAPRTDRAPAVRSCCVITGLRRRSGRHGIQI